jgi:2-C-methyl-D-erythritol 4-phosphate cytidylyltransferase
VDDDAALVEALGTRVHIVPGSPDNFKVTHPRDLVLLRALLAERS